MGKRLLGDYFFLFFSFLAGGWVLFIYQHPSNASVARLGYIIISSGLLLLTMKNWARLVLLGLSFTFDLFYLYLLFGTFWDMRQGGNPGMGFMALFPAFLYSISLTVYLLMPRIKQRYI